MFDDRKRLHDFMGEVEKMIEEMEKDLEKMVSSVWARGEEALPGPMFYGVRLGFDPEGKPVIKTFGDLDRIEEGVREPIYDQVIDKAKGELRITAEMPGVSKGNISLQATEDQLIVLAETEGRRYRADMELKAKVEPDTARAKCLNGVLEVVLSLKDKTNKGFSKINVE